MSLEILAWITGSQTKLIGKAVFVTVSVGMNSACFYLLSLFFSFEVANTLRMNAPIHIYHSGFL